MDQSDSIPAAAAGRSRREGIAFHTAPSYKRFVAIYFYYYKIFLLNDEYNAAIFNCL